MVKKEEVIDNCKWCDQENQVAAKVCSRCGSPNWIFTPEDQAAFEARQAKSEVSEANIINKRYEVGSHAARVAEKYAKVWDSFGSVILAISFIAVAILIIGTLVTPLSAGIKFMVITFWVLIGFLSYLQTTLIKGGAAFMQMMASDYIIRHDFED